MHPEAVRRLRQVPQVVAGAGAVEVEYPGHLVALEQDVVRAVVAVAEDGPEPVGQVRAHPVEQPPDRVAGALHPTLSQDFDALLDVTLEPSFVAALVELVDDRRTVLEPQPARGLELPGVVNPGQVSPGVPRSLRGDGALPGFARELLDDGVLPPVELRNPWVTTRGTGTSASRSRR